MVNIDPRYEVKWYDVMMDDGVMGKRQILWKWSQIYDWATWEMSVLLMDENGPFGLDTNDPLTWILNIWCMKWVSFGRWPDKWLSHVRDLIWLRGKMVCKWTYRPRFWPTCMLYAWEGSFICMQMSLVQRRVRSVTGSLLRLGMPSLWYRAQNEVR